MYILIFGVASVSFFVLSLVGGVIGAWLYRRDYERRLRSLENSKARGVGMERAERMEAALTEAAQMYGEGRKLEEIAKELLPKYPDVALSLGKKFAKGGLGDLFHQIGGE